MTRLSKPYEDRRKRVSDPWCVNEVTKDGHTSTMTTHRFKTREDAEAFAGQEIVPGCACIVIGWDDGTVTVNGPYQDASIEELDYACRQLALEVEGDEQEDEITRMEGDLPHYRVHDADDVYVQTMGEPIRRQS